MVARLDDDHTPLLAKRLRELAEYGQHERAIELYARANEVARAHFDGALTPAQQLALIERAERLLWDVARQIPEQL